MGLRADPATGSAGMKVGFPRFLERLIFGISVMIWLGIWMPLAVCADPQIHGGIRDETAVLAEVEAGLAMIEAGDMKAAYARLYAANEAAQDHRFSPLSVFYPNAALAVWFHDQGKFAEALRFASTAVTGFEANGLSDHPARVMAGAVQGVALMHLRRFQEATPALRRLVESTRNRTDVVPWHGLAQYALARSVTALGTPDQAELRAAFLSGYRPDWRVDFADALHIRYFQVAGEVSQARADRRDTGAFLEKSAALLRLAEQNAARVPQAQRMFYVGFHGNFLALVGRHREARGFLRRHHDFMRQAGLRNADVWENARRLTTSLFVTEGPQIAYDFLTAELAYARAQGASAEAQALYLRELGHLSTHLGDPARAQQHFRAAYATARKVVSATSSLAQHLRGFIAVDAPGFQEFEFANELQYRPPPPMRADGGGTLEWFLKGDYAALNTMFQQMDPQVQVDPALAYLNLALFHALVGAPERMQDALEMAHAAALRGGSVVSPDSATFDLINALGFGFGSEHAPERAANSVNALRKRADQLSESENLMRLALSVQIASQLADPGAMKHFLRQWQAAPRARSPQGSWDIFANLLGLEMAYGNLDPKALTPIAEATLAAMGPADNYALARAFHRLSWHVLRETDTLSQDTLAERALTEQALRRGLPPGHSVLSAAQMAMATTYLNRGEPGSAVEWMARAISTLRASPYHNRDRLAYLLARQARAMMTLGDVAQAASLSEEALAMIDSRTEGRGYLGELLLVRVNALWAVTERAESVVAFLEDWLSRPGLLSQVRPEERVDLLSYQAVALSQMARTLADVDVALAGFERAREAMQMRHWDWRSKRAQLDLDQARLQYRAGRLPEAWNDVRRATDTYVNWAADLSGSVPAAARRALQQRANWEAAIGWELAQSLPGAAPLD